MDDPPMTIPQTLREIDGGGYLEKTHPHPLDSILSFQEEGHHYWVRGVRHDALHYLSSTTFLGSFFPKFDKEQCIGFIMRSDRYVNDPEYKYYRMSEDDILAMWDALGKEASHRGSVMHANIEYSCNQMTVKDDTPEFQQYLNFRAENPNLMPWRTEMLILHEQYRIVGSVDAIFKDLTTGKYVIIDWKRSKKVDNKGGEQGYFPLEHLKGNNLTKYSIQLSLYRYILETVYNLPMAYSMLVVCHPNQNNYCVIKTKYMKEEVELMLSSRLLQLYKGNIIPMPDEVKNSPDIKWDMVRDLE